MFIIVAKFTYCYQSVIIISLVKTCQTSNVYGTLQCLIMQIYLDCNTRRRIATGRSFIIMCRQSLDGPSETVIKWMNVITLKWSQLWRLTSITSYSRCLNESACCQTQLCFICLTLFVLQAAVQPLWEEKRRNRKSPILLSEITTNTGW
jgi:hypothetical protein